MQPDDFSALLAVIFIAFGIIDACMGRFVLPKLMAKAEAKSMRVIQLACYLASAVFIFIGVAFYLHIFA